MFTQVPIKILKDFPFLEGSFIECCGNSVYVEQEANLSGYSGNT